MLQETVLLFGCARGNGKLANPILFAVELCLRRDFAPMFKPSVRWRPAGSKEEIISVVAGGVFQH